MMCTRTNEKEIAIEVNVYDYAQSAEHQESTNQSKRRQLASLLGLKSRNDFTVQTARHCCDSWRKMVLLVELLLQVEFLSSIIVTSPLCTTLLIGETYAKSASAVITLFGSRNLFCCADSDDARQDEHRISPEYRVKV